MSDDTMRERLTKATLDDLGPHNGMGEPDPAGSYRALRLSEEYSADNDWPQSLAFLVPAHQFTAGWRDDRAVPDGWRLVPVEPTDAMLTAYAREICDGRLGGDCDQRAYAAMLSAAPSPPAGGDDGEALRAEIARLREALEQIAGPGYVQDKDAPMFAEEWGDIARAALASQEPGHG